MPTQKQRDTAREVMRRTATKHGLACGETKSTYYLCKTLLVHSRESVAEEWWDLESFVRGVLHEIGPRPCMHHMLEALPDCEFASDGTMGPFTYDWKPGFVRWVLNPTAMRSKRLPPHPRGGEWELYLLDQRWWVRPKGEEPACPAVMK